MISRVTGRLVARELDRVEILTAGGVGYEVAIPLSVYEALPRIGEEVTLVTHLVVKEDGWQLVGFTTPFERRVFEHVLAAKGVGPSLALNLLSSLSAERLVRALREKDVATLQSVPRVGRKKAEQLILDVADKLDDVAAGAGVGPRADGAAAEDAVRALVSLGYATGDAERAIRAVLDEERGAKSDAAELVRRGLTKIAGGRR